MNIKIKLLDFRHLLIFLYGWYKYIPQAKEVSSKKISYVIVPCDPWYVGGSRGDEAMILATIQHLQEIEPGSTIYIVTSTDEGNRYVNRLNIDCIKPLMCWNGIYPFDNICTGIAACQPKEVFILGADCMDGYYSPKISLMLLALHHVFSISQDIKSHLLSFSFNANPSWIVCQVFKLLNNKLKINLRDAVSLMRYERRIGAANLLADTAFALHYDENFDGFNKLKDWIERRKLNGQKIIAFNLHPMLKKNSADKQLEADADNIVCNLSKMMQRHQDISLVLLPHDAREGITDNYMLLMIFNKMYSEYGERLYYDKFVYRASQLKGLCGLFDALISSRMHLAIAALGREVPVMAATYQGKFEGLFLHFGLPEDFLMSPESFCSDKFQEVFDKFYDNLPILHQTIKRELHKVISLSLRNFE